MNPIYLKQFIEKAIKEEAYLKIDYIDSKSKITRDRIIQPLELKKKDGKEYDSLTAHCMLRDDLRQFDFIGIQKIEVAGLKDL